MKASVDRSGIAIIGLACRFPGAPDHHAFWRNLCDGVESIEVLSDADLVSAGVPPDLARDPAYVRAASVLPAIEGFDAAFFEYSPQETRLMDPQQRLLLEVAWSAFEDAGHRPGGRVGVFVGLGGVVSSYLVDRLAHAGDLPGDTGSLSHLGNDKDFASTRVSYKLGLEGPSVNVQTACSTSIVALHLACQSLLNGECDMALAGASAVRVPQRAGYLSIKGSIQSPDGHCRPFDAAAQGTIFGSGVGAVLLKELDQAIADRDHIYAVIRGSAINNDGAQKVSYTASSVAGQSQAMVEAMSVAQILPDHVQYVECHGTGTIVGDPLEVQALTRAFRTTTDRRGFCAIGSVKGNIGHLEQAAGMASLIKTALALEHKKILPSINFSSPNPKINFAASPFFVNTECRDWPNGEQPRCATLNSLGLGGTNAFVVIEEAPPAPAMAEDDKPDLQLLVLSAKTVPALTQLVQDHRVRLDASPDADLADMCFTASSGRVHLPHRVYAVAGSIPDLRDKLADAAPRQLPDGAGRDRKLAFLFSGQASQYAGMSAELYRAQPVFRDILDRCSEHLRARLDRPLRDILLADRDGGVDATGYTQPALYAVQTALVELWRSWGIVPDIVLGHSVGELAAAYCAGVYALEQGLELISERARLMQALPEGAMAAIFADEATVSHAVQQHGAHDLAIAATNGPHNTVISGSRAAVEAVATHLAGSGVTSQTLKVSRAFHSPLMDPAMAEFQRMCADVDGRKPRIEWISTVTAAAMEDAPDAAYWRAHARNRVRFLDGVRVVADGTTDFVEIGPGNTLLALGRICAAGADQAWLASLLKGEERRTILSSLGELYRRGYDVDWNGFNKPQRRRRVPLPTYPFEHKSFWLTDGPRAGRGLPAANSGLTGVRLRSPLPDAQFDAAYGLGRFPYLADHRIYGAPVLPLTAALVALHGAARAHFAADDLTLANLQYRKAMVLPDDGDLAVQSIVTPVDAATANVMLASAAPDGTPPDGATPDGAGWRTHVVGMVRRNSGGQANTAAASPVAAGLLAAIAQRCELDIPVDRYYAAVHALGLEYGASFRGIVALRRGRGEALARVKLPKHLAGNDAFGQHPALLDACLHVYPALVDPYGDFSQPPADPRRTFLPIGIERFSMSGVPADDVWAHAVRTGAPDADTLTADIIVYRQDGAIAASMEGLTLKRLTADALLSEGASAKADWLYQMRWDEVAPPPPSSSSDGARAPAAWLILGDRSGVGDALAGMLSANGDVCRVVRAAEIDPSGELLLSIADLAARMDGIAAEVAASGGVAVRGIVNLWPLDVPADVTEARELDQAQRLIIKSAAALFRAFAEIEPTRASPRIWLVSRGAVSALPDDPPASAVAATLWGLGRSAALEHPQLWGGLLDLDGQSAAAAANDARALISELLHGDDEDQVAVRAGRRLAARLVRMPPPANGAVAFDPAASYLVTGGLGAVGVELAKWLAVRHGVKRLVLASRRGEEDPRAASVRTTLHDLGAEAVVIGADVASPDDVRRLLDRISEQHAPLKGIFHCAGLLDDGILARMDFDKFERVIAPKVTGAWLLDRLTRQHPVDHFVLFSSVLSLIGSAGQANYAAANTFLDALAARRRRQGLPALAMNWGPWAAEGLATASGDKGRTLWRNRGTRYIKADVAWRTLDLLVGGDAGHAAITLTEWPIFTRQFTRVPSLYRELQKETASDKSLAQRDMSAEEARTRLHALAQPERRNLLVRILRQEAMKTLGVAEMIDTARPLRELGLDSLMSVMLVNRLESAFGIRIPMVKLIQGPSIDHIVDDLLPQLGETEPRTAASESVARPRAPQSSWLVVVGRRARPSGRLFCFPFAGGGSAVYRDWAEAVDPSIEVVAIEPPGRLTRIAETPVDDIGEFVDRLLPEMRPMLDKPFALFGHCLGGLTMYETTRRLIHSTDVRPAHLFVSGARPPDCMTELGPFEERLARDLADFAQFRVNWPAHMQPDEVFAEIIRHFRIVATEQLLDDPRLRALMLPVIRAEFRLATNYQFVPEAPWDIPITCFFARDDPYVSRQHALGWGRFTNGRFQVFARGGAHFAVAEDAAFLTSTISREFQREALSQKSTPADIVEYQL